MFIFLASCYSGFTKAVQGVCCDARARGEEPHAQALDCGVVSVPVCPSAYCGFSKAIGLGVTSFVGLFHFIPRMNPTHIESAAPPMTAPIPTAVDMVDPQFAEPDESVSPAVGIAVGTALGATVGLVVGAVVGFPVGWTVSLTVGVSVGPSVGRVVGSEVGAAVGP